MNYPPCPCCGGQNATLKANNQYTCNYCGHVYSANAANNSTQAQANNNKAQGKYAGKDKMIAGLLGIFLGGFGAHQFYLGNTNKGLIYLLVTILTGLTLSWIPGTIGFIEGIMILIQNDEEFVKQPSLLIK